MSTLAVVIPTRNMGKYLDRALASVCHGGADEIVVVDDASEDDTAAIVGRWRHQYKNLTYVRHATKSADHNAAQRDVWLSLKSDQVLGMGADDYLYPGAIAALKSQANAPVVFGDADTTDEAGGWLYAHQSDFYGVRPPSEVRARFASPSNLIESGCGSALRADMVRWLWHMGWEQLGPLMDSIGYGTVAALYGASYVMTKTVSVTVSQSSYGHRSRWTDDEILRWAHAAVEFMRYAGLDHETVRALARKRCYVELSE